MKLTLSLLLACLYSTAYAVGSPFSASVSGNWNDGATWGNASPGSAGVDYPNGSAVGDIAKILPGVSVTIPAGYTVWTDSCSLISGTSASHTKLIVNGHLKLAKNIPVGTSSSGYAELNAGPGSTITLAGYNLVMKDDGFSYNYFEWQGNASSRITVAGGGGGFVQAGDGGYNYVSSNFSYVDFSSMAQTGTSYLTEGTTFSMSHVTYSSSARLTLPLIFAATPPQNRYIEYSDFRAPTESPAIYFDGGNLATPTQRNEMVNTTISSVAPSAFVEVQVLGKAVNFRDNVFDNSGISNVGDYGEDCSIKDSIFFTSRSVVGSTYINMKGSCTITGNVHYLEKDNPHIFGGHSTHTIESNVIIVNIQGTITDDGDVYLMPAAAGKSSGTLSRNLMIGVRGSAVLFSVQGGATSSDTTKAHNNTVYFNPSTSVTDDCFRVGETYGGRPGYVESIQNNLCVATSSSTDATIVRDANIAAATDKISTANYNGNWNIAGTKYQTTKSVGAYGANDIEANPNFVDSTRTPLSWDSTLGGPGTYENARNQMLRINGVGGSYNSAYSLSALLTYIRAGFAPQNQSYLAAGFDGSDIGAIAVSIPSTSSPPTFSGIGRGGIMGQFYGVGPGGVMRTQ